MFPKMSKRAKVSSLIGFPFLLLLVGAIYLYYQHTAVPVQERIYEVPERSERQTAPPPTVFQRTPVHSTLHTSTAEEPHHGDIDTAHDHESDTSASTEVSNLFPIEASFPAEPVLTEGTHDAEQARIADLEAQVEKLTNAIGDKYPEIALLATVSPAEFDELYPTPEERIELAQTLEKAHGEFLRDFRSLFSQLPAAVRAEALTEAHDHFTTHMGQGMADAIMKEVRSQLGE